MTERTLRENIAEIFRSYSWTWEVVRNYACGCEVCLDRQKDGIDRILELLEEAKKQEREKIMALLEKAYPAITTWQCWQALKDKGGDLCPKGR